MSVLLYITYLIADNFWIIFILKRYIKYNTLHKLLAELIFALQIPTSSSSFRFKNCFLLNNSFTL